MTEILQGPLTRLSLTKGAPRVLSNDERARIFRAAFPSPRQNAYPWPHTRTYNPDPPTREEVRQAFEFKYGSPHAA